MTLLLYYNKGIKREQEAIAMLDVELRYVRGHVEV